MGESAIPYRPALPWHVLSAIILSLQAVDSELSTTSVQSGFSCRRSFKSKDLQRFLGTITEQVDLSAVALILYSNEVIELQTAHDLLQFNGTGGREKSLKVLEIYSQLQKQEDRVPFFLRSLLDSGDSSPTNRKLYEKLSDELFFSDSDVDEACKIEDFKRRSVSQLIVATHAGHDFRCQWVQG